MGSKRARNKGKNGARASDIPSIKTHQIKLQQMKQFKEALPILQPLLGLSDESVINIESSLQKVSNLEKDLAEHVAIIDHFTATFSEVGWIMFDNMNMQIADRAVAAARATGVEAGEQVLVDYYKEDVLKFHLQMMSGIKAFKPRSELAQKAARDFVSGRYYASVLVVLTLMDGLVNELHEKRRGFFAEGTELNAWDSIAAQECGLGTLIRLFGKGRYKTTSDDLRIPFRNGIIHGTDLGYDNPLVAAKLWAAFFAVGDWARRVESGLTEPPSAKVEPSLRDVLEQHEKNRAEFEQLEQWIPRGNGQDIDVEFPLQPGTPESVAADYLQLWEKKNYGFMAKHHCHFWHRGDEKVVKNLREELRNFVLTDFQIVKVCDAAPAISEVTARCLIAEDGEPNTVEQRFRMIFEDSLGDPHARGHDGAEWKLATWPRVC